MTVREMIRELEKWSPDSEVVVSSGEDGAYATAVAAGSWRAVETGEITARIHRYDLRYDGGKQVVVIR